MLSVRARALTNLARPRLQMVFVIAGVLVMLFTAAETSSYRRYPSSYCQGIHCSGARCSGQLFASADASQSECESRCEAQRCSCWQWRNPSDKHPSPLEPACLTTNESNAVHASTYGYAAYVDTAKPPSPVPAPTPTPSSARISNYACRSETGSDHYRFCNVSLPIETRLDDLVARMTVSEKASQLQARSSPPIDRLGIPFFCWGQNAITGLDDAVFPIAPAMAATFNITNNVAAMAEAIAMNARVGFNQRTTNHSCACSALESQLCGYATDQWFLLLARGRGFTAGYTCPGSIVTWGPTVNIDRDPRWGRNFETPSEDPFVNGLYAATFAGSAQRGPHSEDERYLKTIVTVKHWAAYSVDNYNGPDEPPADEGGKDRYTFNAIVDDYNFFDTYAKPFEMAVRIGDARGLMCAYNELNGVPACMSPFLRDVLRNNFSFTGMVTSDTDAISPANNHHNYSHTPLEAVRGGLRDGRCDVESSVHSENWYVSYVPELVKSGELEMVDVDNAVKDIFRVRMEAGLFDPEAGQPFTKLETKVTAAADAEEAARDAVVLLKNEGNIIPLGRGSKVLLTGPFATQSFGEAIAAIDSSAQVTIVEGCSATGDSFAGFAKATDAVKASDVVILCLGSEESLEHEYHDRNNASLPGVQAEFAQAVLATAADARKAAVAVLSNRGSLSVDHLKASCPAILLGWAPGGGGSPSMWSIDPVVEALYGVFSPAGKTPYTIYPASYIDEENYFQMSMTSGIGRSYRYYTGEPLWPFGWGLTLTDWSLTLGDNLDATFPSATLDNAVSLGNGGLGNFTILLANTGERHSDEVVFVYVSPQFNRSDCPVPRRQLIDFRRTHVRKAEQVALVFSIASEQLYLVNRDGTRSAYPGHYVLEFTNGVNATASIDVDVVS